MADAKPTPLNAASGPDTTAPDQCRSASRPTPPSGHGHAHARLLRLFLSLTAGPTQTDACAYVHVHSAFPSSGQTIAALAIPRWYPPPCRDPPGFPRRFISNTIIPLLPLWTLPMPPFFRRYCASRVLDAASAVRCSALCCHRPSSTSIAHVPRLANDQGLRQPLLEPRHGAFHRRLSCPSHHVTAVNSSPCHQDIVTGPLVIHRIQSLTQLLFQLTSANIYSYTVVEHEPFNANAIETGAPWIHPPRLPVNHAAAGKL
jgi:hypothetical protein